MKLDAKNFGLAGGILWGAVFFITTLISTGTGYASAFLGVFVNLYPGYTITLLGSVIGLIYGFIDGFVGLFVLAWLYNKLSKGKSS
tara:strand:- start:696 stop:953 length:258 start_codon:yes stop_codon:yes gene_type:complete